jgi:hypothetical protein
VAKSLVCANELLTRGLIYPHVLIDMPYVMQKILPYMPRGRNMTISSALIYIYIDIDYKFLNKEVFGLSHLTS